MELEDIITTAEKEFDPIIGEDAISLLSSDQIDMLDLRMDEIIEDYRYSSSKTLYGILDIDPDEMELNAIGAALIYKLKKKTKSAGVIAYIKRMYGFSAFTIQNKNMDGSFDAAGSRTPYNYFIALYL